MRRLFVGNVDFSVSKPALRSLFQQFGVVESVALVSARDTGQTLACGFVEMANDGEAESASRSLNGAEFGGRRLIVNDAPPRSH